MRSQQAHSTSPTRLSARRNEAQRVPTVDRGREKQLAGEVGAKGIDRILGRK